MFVKILVIWTLIFLSGCGFYKAVKGESEGSNSGSLDTESSANPTEETTSNQKDDERVDQLSPSSSLNLQKCAVNQDCIVVPYSHCCGSTKRAINKMYKKQYLSDSDLQTFQGDCSNMGACLDDSEVTSAVCKSYSSGSSCVLNFP